MKFEAAQQATRKDRHPIRAVNESDTSNSTSLQLDHRYRSQCVYHSERSGSKIKRETYLDPTPRGATDRDGEKIDIHGKLIVKIKFGDATYQHAVYVADIADPFILGLDFLKEHGFTLDFNKNELRSIHEEVTIFKIEHRSESIRQVTANENITIPPRTEIIVPGYIGNDVSFNSGLIGSAENKANGLLIASTLVDLSRKLSRKSSAERLFQEFEDVFSRNSSNIGHTTVTQHRIDTADHPPIKQHPRRLPFAKQEEVGTLLREMQENDIIEPSSSPWASPIVLVRKKDGSTRYCVDYRKLNDVTKKDSYPLPRIDDILDTLSGHKWFSTLDLKSGYWQVEIHPEDREKTAFTSGQGLWQFKVMPFGLCNAPATFERLMETVLKGLTFEACLIYLDDVIIGGRTFEEHLQNIRKVLSKLSDANLKLNPSKCKFFQKEVNYSRIWDTSSLQKLKEALTSSPILIYPQPDKPFILDTDASNEGVGAVLSQEIDGQERVVAYWSQVARWIQRLNEYYFDIRHRKGSHGNADALQEDHAQKIVVIVPE
ncbi:retrovirus-related Pol polyprotein from transposon 297 [Trichonephila clavipes]|uniref:Retrovirus-related Pol polyprotein from transposon 297 n=1 Tax=Trichonephila clavipes TaxID=2585209 RepID=A0A8X7BCF1_TRICX|nr:retrovirus-related Pol polyprotein from transposon 297 [Trichonephila clavipes]